MKLVSLLILGLLLCPVAVAQEYPKAEFYAGYAYVGVDDETVDLMGLSPGLFGTATRIGANLNGWNITINGNPTKWLGVAFGQSISSDETAFAFGAGGGIDVKSSNRISVRTLQVDYIFTRFDGQGIDHGAQRALRISTGLVFRYRD